MARTPKSQRQLGRADKALARDDQNLKNWARYEAKLARNTKDFDRASRRCMHGGKPCSSCKGR